jgi:hypothetical protein
MRQLIDSRVQLAVGDLPISVFCGDFERKLSGAAAQPIGY